MHRFESEIVREKESMRRRERERIVGRRGKGKEEGRDTGDRGSSLAN